jgi:hypothetical protein
MCKFWLVVGVALIFFGLATLAHDVVNQGNYSTTVGDVIGAIGIPYSYQQFVLNSSDVFRILINLPFAYAAVLAGILTSIIGAVCARAGSRPES